MQECFVAFIDVLGIKKLVNDWHNNIDLVNEIIHAIKINSKITQADTKRTSRDGNLDVRSFYFSDSFAFVMKKEPRNLPHLFLILRYLQDRFWDKGFCFRGAVVIGDMYFPRRDEDVLIGKGISDAYKLESQIAIYPRIVISEDLFKYIKTENIDGWPFLEKQSKEHEISLIDGIKKDKDGVYFLDLLNPKVLRKEGEEIKHDTNIFSITWMNNFETSYSHILEKVENIVNNSLNNNNNPKIRQKYEWLKNYLEEKQKEPGK